jgi:hypothetical protein
MKRTMAPTVLAIAFATMFVPGIVPGAQADEQGIEVKARHRGCSNASLQGSFGFTATGIFSRSRDHLPALSRKSVGRPSRGEAIRPDAVFPACARRRAECFATVARDSPSRVLS